MNRKEASWSWFDQIYEYEFRVFLEPGLLPVEEHVLGDGALLLSSIDLQRRRLRLLAFQPTAP